MLLSSVTCALQERNHMLPGLGGCHVRHLKAWSCTTLDTKVALEGSGYVEQVYGVELGRTRRGVMSGIQHLVNFEV